MQQHGLISDIIMNERRDTQKSTYKVQVEVKLIHGDRKYRLPLRGWG